MVGCWDFGAISTLWKLLIPWINNELHVKAQVYALQSQLELSSAQAVQSGQHFSQRSLQAETFWYLGQSEWMQLDHVVTLVLRHGGTGPCSYTKALSMAFHPERCRSICSWTPAFLSPRDLRAFTDQGLSNSYSLLKVSLLYWRLSSVLVWDRIQEGGRYLLSVLILSNQTNGLKSQRLGLHWKSISSAAGVKLRFPLKPVWWCFWKQGWGRR